MLQHSQLGTCPFPPAEAAGEGGTTWCFFALREYFVARVRFDKHFFPVIWVAVFWGFFCVIERNILDISDLHEAV